MGAPPPIGTLPTRICLDFLRMISRYRRTTLTLYPSLGQNAPLLLENRLSRRFLLCPWSTSGDGAASRCFLTRTCHYRSFRFAALARGFTRRGELPGIYHVGPCFQFGTRIRLNIRSSVCKTRFNCAPLDRTPTLVGP